MTKLTFKVQFSLVIIILIFFSGGNRLQIFRAHHPQHDCVDEGRFVVPQYFHCYHAGIRFRCILHLQYGFRYLYIVVILYHYARADMCMRSRAEMNTKVQMCKIVIISHTCKRALRKNVCDIRAGAEKCVRCADAAQILAH